MMHKGYKASNVVTNMGPFSLSRNIGGGCILVGSGKERKDHLHTFFFCCSDLIKAEEW